VSDRLQEVFEAGASFPSAEARERYGRLVGIDAQRDRLLEILAIMVNRQGLETWASAHHPDAPALVSTVTRRPPLVVLAGDVGCGKTELAETVGDAVARREKISITLLPLSLATRGQGRVGEMTQLLSTAFDHLIREAQKVTASSGRHRGAVILLVDEADALAQSREASQMHHEDRAGVNAFIRGIDRVANERLPAAVLMCTNRLSSLDPAIRRRAAEVLRFDRPDEDTRFELLSAVLAGTGLEENDLRALAKATGARTGQTHGYTYSDIVQRLVPSLVLDAYPSGPITAKRAVAIASELVPTPTFDDRA